MAAGEWREIDAILEEVRLPDMIRAEQVFPNNTLRECEETLREQLRRRAPEERIKPGMRIAVTAGSRGIFKIEHYLRIVGEYLRELGALPFIVPAMGSHGGATAAGQEAVLAAYGISEQSVKMQVFSSMETVRAGMIAGGTPLYLDRYAFEADGIVLVNRIKAHTQFRGSYESGLIKMLVIGLGKQAGADICHAGGLDQMAGNLQKMGAALLERTNVLFGVGLIENALDKTCEINVLKKEEILTAEPALLCRAKENMAGIKLADLDVLIVEQIGKNYSGSGMDPNVTGRFYNQRLKTESLAKRIVVLGLSKETHGNGCGIGMADVTTRRLVEELDRGAIYMNGLTSLVSESGRIPIYFNTDRQAIQAAVKLSGKKEGLRIVHIANTMELEAISISEALLKEAQARDDLILHGKKEPMRFDDDGRLIPCLV